VAVGAAEAVQGLFHPVADGVGVGVVVVGVVIGQGEVVADLLGERRQVAEVAGDPGRHAPDLVVDLVGHAEAVAARIVRITAVTEQPVGGRREALGADDAVAAANSAANGLVIGT
jgi:hypothetical protein